jgi:hypothetical protein
MWRRIISCRLLQEGYGRLGIRHLLFNKPATSGLFRRVHRSLMAALVLTGVSSVEVSSQEGSWVIQLAATPSYPQAEDILARARARASIILQARQPYIETMVREDVTLHRARFIGFPDREAAQEACRQLTRVKFACLALQSERRFRVRKPRDFDPFARQTKSLGRY